MLSWCNWTGATLLHLGYVLSLSFKIYSLLQICSPFTIRGISMPSGIQTSGTPQDSSLPGSLVPFITLLPASSARKRGNSADQYPSRHTDHSFPKPFCLMHWMKQVSHTKRSCYHVLLQSLRNTIKLEMCWCPWFHCSQLIHISRLCILHH